MITEENIMALKNYDTDLSTVPKAAKTEYNFRVALRAAIETLNEQIDEKAINSDDETEGHFHFVHGYLTCKKTGKDIKYPLVSIEDFAYCPRCGKKLRWS